VREFSWRYFTLTGDIEAYLLYRSQAQQGAKALDSNEEQAEEAPALTN